MPISSIVLEGGEGSGKGTVSRFLAQRLETQGHIVHTTREPGGQPLCEAIRTLILGDEYADEMDELTEAYLFASSRAQLMANDILPASKRGEFIIIDRFVYSSYVYQGIIAGLGVDTVMRLNESAMRGWRPDLIVFLDIEPSKALERIFSNPSREVNRNDLKEIEFHEKVRQGYLSLSETIEDYHIINADRTPAEIVDDIMELIQSDTLQAII